MRDKLLQNNKGFTLAEVMVALSLILVLSAIYTSLYFSGNAANTRSKQRLDAIVQGQNIMEQLKSADKIEEGNTELIIGRNNISKDITIEKVIGGNALYSITLKISTKNTGDVVLATKIYKSTGGSME